jgi:hypothetical protein
VVFIFGPKTTMVNTISKHADVFFARRFKVVPTFIVTDLNKGLDVFINLSTANITDIKFFTKLENFLIKNPAVHSDNDCNIAAIFFSDFGNNMKDHLFHSVAMIGMLVAAAKNRIDKQTSLSFSLRNNYQSD